MAEKRKYTTITIPAQLFEKLEKKIQGTGFSSVSDYVQFLLREFLIEADRPESKSHKDVIEKLHALGYA